MTWAESHREAELLAQEAEVLMQNGEQGQARMVYEQAAQQEEAAYFCLAKDKPRTRGITAVSTIALYAKAGDTLSVQNTGAMFLGLQLPAFAVKQIQEMIEELDK